MQSRKAFVPSRTNGVSPPTQGRTSQTATKTVNAPRTPSRNHPERSRGQSRAVIRISVSPARDVSYSQGDLFAPTAIWRLNLSTHPVEHNGRKRLPAVGWR